MLSWADPCGFGAGCLRLCSLKDIYDVVNDKVVAVAGSTCCWSRATNGPVRRIYIRNTFQQFYRAWSIDIQGASSERPVSILRDEDYSVCLFFGTISLGNTPQGALDIYFEKGDNFPVELYKAFDHIPHD